MSEGSCTSCKQVYNYPPEEEIESEHIEEESLSEESKHESSQDSISGDSSELSGYSNFSEMSSLSEDLVYDGENLVPELSDFFIKDDTAEEFHFDELLFVMNRTSLKKIGSMKIIVEHLKSGDYFVLSHYFFSRRTKIFEVYNYGYVRRNFNSTNEMRYEVEIDVMRRKRTVHSLYVRPIEENFVLTEQYRYDTTHYVKNKTEFSFEDFLNVTTESANILIMRQLAKKDFTGYKFVKNIITNREVCETQFKCYPFEWCRVNNKKTELKRIRKRVILPTNEMQESNAYLTRNGQLALVAWCGDEHYVVIDPKAVITPGYHPKDPYYLRPLMMRYLSTPVVKRMIEMDTNRQILKSKNYIADHPEVMAIISYIVKQILVTKPHKVILFVKRCILPYL
ncbi:uncharacterized protein [Halyomorpha halys]|uniref:uncharacterized protein n=1 Tax=Halyomorpha halys TaxID=286706 RepID=UPI000D0C83FE|nr:uncharacterized protein LOC112211553 [Halyomorpha halys]